MTKNQMLREHYKHLFDDCTEDRYYLLEKLFAEGFCYYPSENIIEKVFFNGLEKEGLITIKDGYCRLQKQFKIVIGISTVIYREIELEVTTDELQELREGYLPETVQNSEEYKRQMSSEDNITDKYIDTENIVLI